MKSTVAILGACAAVASAYMPGKHLHFPRANDTLSTASPAAEASLTTLTIKTTRTSTIISCAPTVTNCPAGKPEMSTVPESDRQIQTVTETVDLTTTVCPVAEASNVSQQIIEKHNSISATPSQTADQAVSTSDVVIVKTVTLTLGSGDRQSVVPTVITTTSKAAITAPKLAETGAQGNNSEEETSTITATSTTTKTITITRAKPTNTAVANKAAGQDGPAAVTVTVAQTTVTAPASTVYVTLPCEATKPAVAGNKQVVNSSGASGGDDTKPNVNVNDSTGNAGNNAGDVAEAPATTDAPADATPCATDTTTTIEATVTVIPYPANNGTTFTGTAAPSGFARLRR